MRKVDELLAIVPWKEPSSDEETLVCLVSGFCDICHAEESLVGVFLSVLTALKGRGLDFRSLSDEYHGILHGGVKDTYNAIRVLASRHSITKKLLFAAGTLIAMGERKNVDVVAEAQKQVESLAYLRDNT